MLRTHRLLRITADGPFSTDTTPSSALVFGTDCAVRNFIAFSLVQRSLGGLIVNASAPLFLERDRYHLIKNVTLPAESTRSDHCSPERSVCSKRIENERLKLFLAKIKFSASENPQALP